jgi:hypothetical protein
VRSLANSLVARNPDHLLISGSKFWVASGINNQGAIIGLVSRVVNGTILYRFALLTPVSPNQPAATRTP